MSDQKRKKSKAKPNVSGSNNSSRESIVTADEEDGKLQKTSTGAGIETAHNKKPHTNKSRASEKRMETVSLKGISSPFPAKASVRKPVGDGTAVVPLPMNKPRTVNLTKKTDSQTNGSRSADSTTMENGKRSVTRTTSAMQTPQKRSAKPGSKLSRSCDKLHASAEKLSSEVAYTNGRKLSRQRSHGSTGSLVKPLPKVR